MLGSYAGAMGQPQFMPSSYLRYAVDFEGTGKRDIWTSKADVLASIANYLKQSGWRSGEPWGEQVRAQQQGMTGKLVQPDGPGGESFVVFGNFNAIRRYNPSDYYALAVGLLGDAVIG
jgi:membrane-bound lytic murein transglycosylase B